MEGQLKAAEQRVARVEEAGCRGGETDGPKACNDCSRTGREAQGCCGRFLVQIEALRQIKEAAR
jgi:hypothetical protein